MRSENNLSQSKLIRLVNDLRRVCELRVSNIDIFRYEGENATMEYEKLESNRYRQRITKEDGRKMKEGEEVEESK